ncbi:uroporphyrinogen-III C-methyltransferase [Chitinivibrio alkaliphilus]|uniref:Hydroxymethylbilane synthase n=1 Tax=Chitinivibrio alkaliphilus ACht1 TaxID=1313304 RepID=U7DDN1_9BACT|nr:uroporphyrinogen-III C-methyltransferase [Chitinivibrio alkaliphilus]ERP39001.1 hydroxymethylbilane synthase/uroporphyrin-III C-methyltransferase/uroporphyrinogen-III synthase [Chitinivibrio alkaliphilus ACht1]
MKLRIGSRKSPLARAQVEEISALFPHVEWEPHWFDSPGDRDKTTSLMTSGLRDDFFTADIDEKILQGTIDIGAHAAKDMPEKLPSGLVLGAHTEGKDSSDALVSRSGLSLAKLPKKARLGTSSQSRRDQILALRPDLEIVSIRGSIEERLAYLEREEVDAIIVATCALLRLGKKDLITERLPLKTHPLQGKLGLVCRENNYPLLALLHEHDSRKNLGRITLVGAGPGAPDLLTLRGVSALKSADIVFYDALLDPRLLDYCTRETVFVGKRKGKHSHPQEDITARLLAAARRGKRVVRLKGGDPLLFSRGGEEIRAARREHIHCEVIPGISSFQAAAAAARIPLTLRETAGGFAAFSAHYGKNTTEEEKHRTTQAVFMGTSRPEEVKAELLRRGLDPADPVVAVHRTAWPDEQIEHTTVEALPQIELRPPGIYIAGPCATSVEESPRILFTGISPERVYLPRRICPYPLIQLQSRRATFPSVDFEGILFTSHGGVEHYLSRWDIPSKVRVAAVGPHTAHELQRRNISVDYIPPVADSQHLAEEIIRSDAASWLYPCSNRSDNILHSIEKVYPLAVYDTLFRTQPKISLTRFDALFFTSASTVDAFLDIYTEIPSHCTCLVYGDPTKKHLMNQGVPSSRIVRWPMRKHTL